MIIPKTLKTSLKMIKNNKKVDNTPTLIEIPSDGSCCFTSVLTSYKLTYPNNKILKKKNLKSSKDLRLSVVNLLIEKIINFEKDLRIWRNEFKMSPILKDYEMNNDLEIIKHIIKDNGKKDSIIIPDHLLLEDKLFTKEGVDKLTDLRNVLNIKSAVKVNYNYKNFGQYITHISNNKSWGGEIELSIMKDILNCTICVHQDNAPSVYYKNTNTKHMIHIIREKSVHYNSLIFPFPEGFDNDEIKGDSDEGKYQSREIKTAGVHKHSDEGKNNVQDKERKEGETNQDCEINDSLDKYDGMDSKHDGHDTNVDIVNVKPKFHIPSGKQVRYILRFKLKSKDNSNDLEINSNGQGEDPKKDEINSNDLEINSNEQGEDSSGQRDNSKKDESNSDKQQDVESNSNEQKDESNSNEQKDESNSNEQKGESNSNEQKDDSKKDESNSDKQQDVESNLDQRQDVESNSSKQKDSKNDVESSCDKQQDDSNKDVESNQL